MIVRKVNLLHSTIYQSLQIGIDFLEELDYLHLASGRYCNLMALSSNLPGAYRVRLLKE